MTNTEQLNKYVRYFLILTKTSGVSIQIMIHKVYIEVVHVDCIVFVLDI